MSNDNTDIDNKIRDKIRLHRDQLGLTQQQVADRMKVSLRSYQLYESHPARLTLEKLSEIASSLNVKIFDLLGSSDIERILQKEIELLESLNKTKDEHIAHLREELGEYKTHKKH